MKCSYGKISSPLTEIPGTEPARSLIGTYHQIFYKGFRGKARPRKPDLCEEALNLSIYRTKITYTYLTRLLHGLRYSS